MCFEETNGFITMSEIIAAILGAIVGFIGTYFASTRLFSKQRKLEAASKFREAFSEEIAACKSTDKFSIKEITVIAMKKHEKAVILFEPFLEKSKINKFHKHWNKYCEFNNYKNINELVPESGINMEGHIRELSESEQRTNTLSYLNILIGFAPVT